MDFAMNLAVAVGFLAFLLVLLGRFYRSLWKPYEGLPTCNYAYHFVRLFLAGGFPRNLPTAGCFLHFHKALSELFRKEGFFLGWTGYFHIHVFSPEATKFFITEPAVREKGRSYSLLKIGFGEGLVTCNTKTATQHKRIINPALHYSHFKNFAAVFNRKSILLVEELKKEIENPSMDLLQLLEQNLFDAAIETVIGVTPEEVGMTQELVEECREAVLQIADYLTTRAFKPWLFFDSLLQFFPGGSHAIHLIKRSHGIMQQAVDSYMREDVLSEIVKSRATKELSQNAHYNDTYASSKCKPLVPLLAEAHHKDPEGFTKKDIRDELITVVLGAYHTIVLAAFWTIYLLGLHPEVQDKVFDEVNAKMTDEPSYEDLQDLPYLECIIKESMRLYPPIPAVIRRLNKDVQFGKYRIPAGTEVFFWMYMLHRDPVVFPNPEVFDPDRFAPEKRDQISRFSYIPFAEGPRTCIGKAFTMVEMKVLLFHVIRNFKIVSLDPRDKVPVTWNIVMPPIKTPRIQLTPRDLTGV